jgi:hypothetical protein
VKPSDREENTTVHTTDSRGDDWAFRKRPMSARGRRLLGYLLAAGAVGLVVMSVVLGALVANAAA